MDEELLKKIVMLVLIVVIVFSAYGTFEVLRTPERATDNAPVGRASAPANVMSTGRVAIEVLPAEGG